MRREESRELMWKRNPVSYVFILHDAFSKLEILVKKKKEGRKKEENRALNKYANRFIFTSTFPKNKRIINKDRTKWSTGKTLLIDERINSVPIKREFEKSKLSLPYYNYSFA